MTTLACLGEDDSPAVYVHTAPRHNTRIFRGFGSPHVLGLGCVYYAARDEPLKT